MSEEKAGEELSLLEVYNVVKRYKWWLLVSPIVTSVLAAFWVSYALHPVWEGTALLEVGQATKAKGKEPVELAVNVVARMSQPSFAEGVLKDSGFNSNELNADPNSFVGSLKAAKVKETELVEVSVRAPSQNMALSQLRASIAYLQKVHLKMMEDTIETQRKNLEQTTRDIQITKADLELLKKRLLATRDWNTFDATMVGIILKDKSVELRSMISNKMSLEEQMGPQNTYTTRVVGNVAVSDGPVSPNKRLIIAAAMLFGLFGALVVAFAHKAIAGQTPR